MTGHTQISNVNKHNVFKRNNKARKIKQKPNKKERKTKKNKNKVDLQGR